MTTLTKNLTTDFPNGLKESQLVTEINGSGITTAVCTNINRSGLVVNIIFTAVLSAGDLTTVNNTIAAHIPEPIAFNGLRFMTITNANSPYYIRKYSIYCDTTNGNITTYLPSVVHTKNAVVGVKKIATNGTVTITPSGTDTINGSNSSVTLTTKYQWYVFTNTGNNWVTSTGDVSVDFGNNQNYLFYTNNKGDIAVDSGTGLSALSVGSNGQVLTADSSQPLGVKWAAPTGGGTLSGAYIGDQSTASPVNGSTHTYTVTVGRKYWCFMQVFATKSGGSWIGDICFDMSQGASTTWGTISQLGRQNYAFSTGEIYVFSCWVVVTATSTSMPIVLNLSASSGSGTPTHTNYSTIVTQLN